MNIILTSDKQSSLYRIFGNSAGSAIIEKALSLEQDPQFESTSRAMDLTRAKRDYNDSESGSPEEAAAVLKIIELSGMVGLEQFLPEIHFNWGKPVGMLAIRKVAMKILNHR